MAFNYGIALTGGISTGKSTVSKIFKSYGFQIIDADNIAHIILDREVDKIEELFGKRYIVDGKVDRKALGTLIFSDKENKLLLERLLHPLIFNSIKERAEELDGFKEPYLVDIPLFFETNRYPINEIIVVYLSKELQLERLIKRDKLTIKEALKRIESQIDIEEKRHKATYLIDNQGDLKALQYQCDRVKDKIFSNYKVK